MKSALRFFQRLWVNFPIHHWIWKEYWKIIQRFWRNFHNALYGSLSWFALKWQITLPVFLKNWMSNRFVSAALAALALLSFLLLPWPLNFSPSISTSAVNPIHDGEILNWSWVALYRRLTGLSFSCSAIFRSWIRETVELRTGASFWCWSMLPVSICVNRISLSWVVAALGLLFWLSKMQFLDMTLNHFM